ncbi:MAG: adenosylcobalamin-dependent ribonucleoside-diphosphate reductase [Haloarculaceae archaeon]
MTAPDIEDLGESARTVVRERYLKQDETGAVDETPAECIDRVATDVASVEVEFGSDPDPVAASFRDAMADRDFLPNSPTLMNAGTELEQLAACFVLPVEDSIESIFDALRETALIHQSGGGTGFSFSKLRPAGDVVKSTGGVASGPVSFMRIFDAATEEIKQGGRRRGANMGVLAADHPDVEDFVAAKQDADALRNFNLSVATDAAFWEALAAGDEYDLVNPRTDEVVDSVDPEALLERIASVAWETGDPGLLFLDRIAADNPTPDLGEIRATNPCGEVPLLPHEACVLGSINLAHMTTVDPTAGRTDGEVDWDRLGETVALGVRFLDDAITASAFPVPAITERMGGNRKIGLGVMGFHDMLVDLGVPYDSERALEVAEEVMGFVAQRAREVSRDLATERGPFPNYPESTLPEPQRNATLTSIAPTGTISMVAEVSASIEPIYNVAYTKHVLGGLPVVNSRFAAIGERRDFLDDDLLETVWDRSTVRDVERIPADVRRLFPTAHDVSPDHHVAMQAAFQDHVDNAVSKTVNLPPDASKVAVRRVFERARDLGVKGITVFRSGARPEQVLGKDPLKEECITECEFVGPSG